MKHSPRSQSNLDRLPDFTGQSTHSSCLNRFVAERVLIKTGTHYVPAIYMVNPIQSLEPHFNIELGSLVEGQKPEVKGISRALG